ncbi:MAG: DUF1269 domain-containing protein [Anaerolineales bacterium]|jgi:uncharacterized membrane protein
MSDETTDQGIAGVGLFVAAYVDERGADNALDALKEAKKNDEFYYDDAAVVRRDAEGKVHINETGDMTTGKGAGIGALIGGVLGLLGGPAGVALGLGAGALVGGIAAHGDAGFDNDSLKEIGAALPAGTSALAVTTSKDFVEEVRKQAPDEETLTLARDIATQINDSLSARKDVLMAMVLTEAGVAASKVVSSPEEVAAFGIAATEEGMVARAGVATEEGVVVVDAAAVPVEDEPEDDRQQ